MINIAKRLGYLLPDSLPLMFRESIRRFLSIGLLVLLLAVIQGELPASAEPLAGRLYAWGSNTDGQCNVPTGDDFLAVAGGYSHSLALKADGSLTAWGYNKDGQCNVPAGNDFAAISAAGTHDLALKNDGSLAAWGDNVYGECNVPSGNDFTAIDASEHHWLALRKDGSLATWGMGNYSNPTGNDFTAIALGRDHSLAIKKDGTLAAWGSNLFEQCNVPAGNDYIATAAGDYHSIALKKDGSIVAWGDNKYGQCKCPADNVFTNIDAGSGHSIALKKDGSIVAWGDNRYGQCSVPPSHNFTAISGGGVHTLAVYAEVEPANPTWYLAEGSTAWGFSTYISVENPNEVWVTARVTYMPTGKNNVSEDIPLPAKSQTTLTNDHLRSLLGESDFSTKIECLERKVLAVDRTMSWKGPGAASEEAHCSVGVTAPYYTWYLPEGSSNWGFECWLLIQNPNDHAATCKITYMIEEDEPRVYTKSIGPYSRATFNMADDIGPKDASIKVSSDYPVIPERAMYRNNRREGHDSIGTTAPAYDYYLAEGCTGYGFTTYVLIQNPQDEAVVVDITYMTGSGPKSVGSLLMPPNSRKTINVNKTADLPDPNFSTKVHGDRPIIAERAMYWKGGPDASEVCHDSIGMDYPSLTFYLPDGDTSNGRETWTLVQNPTSRDFDVEISYLTPTGQNNVTFTETIPGRSRRSFNMADKIPNGRASIMVISKGTQDYHKIMVERAMYWNNRGAGTDTIGESSG